MSPAGPKRRRAGAEPAPLLTKPPADDPALGLIELESIARGLVVADALLKRAEVKITFSEPMTPGKYVVVFRGPVAEVEEAFAAATESAGSKLLDTLLLTQAHRALLAGLEGAVESLGVTDALGIVELNTVAATLRAADTALKRAAVKLTHLQLAKGIGGKGWFTLGGPQADVEAAVEGAAASVEPRLLLGTEIIERPHRELKGPGL